MPKRKVIQIGKHHNLKEKRLPGNKVEKQKPDVQIKQTFEQIARPISAEDEIKCYCQLSSLLSFESGLTKQKIILNFRVCWMVYRKALPSCEGKLSMCLEGILSKGKKSDLAGTREHCTKKAKGTIFLGRKVMYGREWEIFISAVLGGKREQSGLSEGRGNPFQFCLAEL